MAEQKPARIGLLDSCAVCIMLMAQGRPLPGGEIEPLEPVTLLNGTALCYEHTVMKIRQTSVMQDQGQAP